MNGWQGEQTGMLEPIFVTIRFLIGICDAAGNFTRINPVMVDMLNYMKDRNSIQADISYHKKSRSPDIVQASAFLIIFNEAFEKSRSV